jgi:hypothetical protein
MYMLFQSKAKGLALNVDKYPAGLERSTFTAMSLLPQPTKIRQSVYPDPAASTAHYPFVITPTIPRLP